MTTPIKYLIALVIFMVILVLTASLASALMPFIIAVIFAYVTSPLANYLEEKGLINTLSATIITILLMLMIVLLPLILVPLIIQQFQQIVTLIPSIIEFFQKWLGDNIIGDISDSINEQLPNVGIETLKNTATSITGVVSSSIAAVSTFLGILLITPLSTFYLIRDRKSISGELTDLLPPAMRERTLLITSDFDNVLGEFFHGQLIVIIIMSVFYSILLQLAGLEFALTIGVISGLLTFIPFVGFIVGLLLAVLVSLSNFTSWIDLFIIISILGVGTTIESIFITPRFVGERVGLHPLLILLSLSVLGALFGFIGLLISLPFASILLVCFRHLRRYYINSNFYSSE